MRIRWDSYDLCKMHRIRRRDEWVIIMRIMWEPCEFCKHRKTCRRVSCSCYEFDGEEYQRFHRFIEKIEKIAEEERYHIE